MQQPEGKISLAYITVAWQQNQACKTATSFSPSLSLTHPHMMLKPHQDNFIVEKASAHQASGFPINNSACQHLTLSKSDQKDPTQDQKKAHSIAFTRKFCSGEWSLEIRSEEHARALAIRRGAGLKPKAKASGFSHWIGFHGGSDRRSWNESFFYAAPRHLWHSHFAKDFVGLFTCMCFASSIQFLHGVRCGFCDYSLAGLEVFIALVVTDVWWDYR
jgi:hypothetical protein